MELTTGNLSSFSEFLSHSAPELLPATRTPGVEKGPINPELAPHGTTIISIVTADGVVIAGDRRATAGNMIASRDIQKVFAADSYSVMGIAGTAGIGLEMMRLFCVELEHYEKIESTTLSLEGKANRLSTMIRSNLGAALQGLIALPLFAGYDLAAEDTGESPGRIYSYDAVGGIYPEKHFHAIGSGSVFAKSALKKRYTPGVNSQEAVKLAVSALYDAADDDTATGGPDLIREIFPVVMIADIDGVRRVSESEMQELVREIVAYRQEHPGG